MTTEQKAKAYDKALEAMSDIIPDENGLVHIRPSDIFPELIGSEGEKHRKWIIAYLNDEFLCADELTKPKLQTAIAWLEKQGNKTEE